MVKSSNKQIANKQSLIFTKAKIKQIKGKKIRGKEEKKRVGKEKNTQTETKGYELQVELKDLLEAGCHFGHSVPRTNPKIKPYLYGSRNNIQIFDLIQTYDLLRKACQAVFEMAKAGKVILFLGTKRQAREIVVDEAKQRGFPYVINRWIGGTVTNWEQIKKSIKKMFQLKKDLDSGVYDSYTKYEQSLVKRELTRLENLFGGLNTELSAAGGPEKIFDAVFVIDIKREQNAIDEAKIWNIPVIAIVDSNADPTAVKYPIPSNDDAVRSIQLIVREIAKAYEAGREQVKN